jgi:proline-specific peptidase
MTLPDPITYPKPPGQERPYPKPTKTGRALFKIPNHDLQGETAYEIYGDLECSKVPLIALHGGPGIPHGYLLPLSLVLTDYGVPVVMYDQIGCGDSTHFPDRIGDRTLWTPELFMAELDNLKQALGITKFDLFGTSWGGILAAHYTTTMQPAGLRKLIISSSPASMKTWMKVSKELRTAMPIDLQDTLSRCEKEGKMETPEYEAATHEFNKRYLCRLDPLPKELDEPLKAWIEDPTVEMTMFGLSDVDITGSLRTWNMEEDLKKLTAEAVPGGILLMNGYFDLAQDECMLPFFKEPSARVKWVRFGLSSHVPQLEETEKYVKALGSFLQD